MAVKIYFPETGGYDIGRNPAFDSDSDPHLNVTVIHTTSEGTFAALKFATDLTAHLGARIRLVALQLVPFRLPIEEPMVSTSFLRQRQLALVSKLGLSEGEVDIQICLCRNERRALLEFLPARSLVILGGVRRWWRPERRLEKWLLDIGHHVLFAAIGSPNPLVSDHLRTVFRPGFLHKA